VAKTENINQHSEEKKPASVSDPIEKQPAEPEQRPEPLEPVKPEPAEVKNQVAEIGAALTGGKAEKQEHFTAKVKEKRAKEKAAAEVEQAGGDWRYLKDSSGRYWSPDICAAAVDPKTGVPKKTTRGLWVLQRGKTKSDRNKLPKRPPNNEAQAQKATAEAEAQQAAEVAAAAVQQRSILYTRAFLSAHKALLSSLSGEKAVSDILGFKIGEGQYSVTVSSLLETAGVSMMVESGGGVELKPRTLFIGGIAATTLACYFHPSKPERKESLKEKAGLLWYRLRNRKKQEPKKEGAKNERL